MTQTEHYLDTRTVNIDTNLSGKENLLVTLDATDEGVVNLAASGAKSAFVLITGADGSSVPTIGTIVTDGLVKVKIGGNVTPGDFLSPKSDGTGKAVTCTADGQAYSLLAMGKGVADDIIVAKVCHGYFYVAA